LLVQQDRRQKATFSVDDDALVLRSVRLNHSPERRSPCRLSPLRRSGDSLGVSRRSPLRRSSWRRSSPLRRSSTVPPFLYGWTYQFVYYLRCRHYQKNVCALRYRL